MTKKDQLTYKMTLRLKKGEIFFGPGVSDVLVLVEKNGSLSKAAQEMNMSYNKAWRIVQKAEKQWGAKLIESQVGGTQGGGSQLTAEGKDLAEKYERFKEKSEKYVSQCFTEIFESDLK
ncbi:MAG TPA: LysR family transcriptional regulator [Tetragenococcus sp.]|nr:LysR family transcriptional regulator [Tetragenococcus sp.]